ncbi:MAG TPA: 4-(cytidine 5'-diphospho)-2-C-methyl-D-erythritol kinase [Rhodospirillaceae bacterium]|nr:4-(cytidine 5'-diphospho)-2-C-methyl-D-erythritol kinase [Rhodospirillaceae bacterium]
MLEPPLLETLAPAKINLYLHVTGRRVDGYHFLDSLVAFTNVGDRLRLTPAPAFDFVIEGPMAAVLAGQDSENNLAVRAARMLAKALDKPLNVRLTLTKNLPIASGIGGGSTDAAAALRLLAAYWKLPPTAPLLHEIAALLGQDVPCCIAAESCYFEGIGDVTSPAPTLPLTHIVLVNPNKGLSTPSVFKARGGAFTPPAPFHVAPETVQDLATLLAARTNSLTEAAIGLCPDIQKVLTAIVGTQECLLSRMSGSGATCFGIYADRSSAKQAAATLYKEHPSWWVVPAFWPATMEKLAVALQ